MSQAIIEATGLWKTYGKGSGAFTALKGVSLIAHPGESIAVLGKSGSGKSTLMHLLALLDTIDDGVLRINGTDVSRLTKSQVNTIRNEEFGFVFQQFFLMPSASVLQNVVLPLKIAGVRRKERNRRASEALKALELDDKSGNKAVNLSGGQKQRVVIARALVSNPRVIFADEPTGNLDSATGQIVENTLFDLNKKHGITLILVTHDPELAARCDRQLFLKDGLEAELQATHSVQVIEEEQR